MNLLQIDKRLFEYLGHLKFGKVDHKTLSWQQHQMLPSSNWKFPDDLEIYFLKVFSDNKDIIFNKDIIDIGCEYGNKIPWFDKFKPKKLTCIDPSIEDMYIANMVGDLVETDTRLITDVAENCELRADTIFMLSVNQHLLNEFVIYEKIECESLVIDTWTDRTPLKDIRKALEKKFYVVSEFYYKPNRVVMRCDRK